MTRSVFLPLAGAATLGACAAPASVVSPDALSPTGWRQHDMAHPQPPRAAVAESPTVPAPPDAIPLVGDGAGLDAWQALDGAPARWSVADGVLRVEPGTGDIRTRQVFGDVHLHVEWRAADEPGASGQNRSNSGVLLMDGRYEVQVLDSWQNETYADGRAGAIYGQYPPLADASLPPDAWQVFDLFFRRPRLDARGAVVEPARLTLLHNGVLVQNNEALAGRTIWLQTLPYDVPHPDAGAVHLQDHGSRVQYRAIWVRPVHERPAPPDTAALPIVALSAAEMDRLVGTYRRPNDAYTVARSTDGLVFSMPWRPEVVMRMEPLSATTFQLARTAGTLRFTLDESGAATGLAFTVGGVTYQAERER